MPTVNVKGLALIESFEGCVLNAYLDSGGIPTIGYGHTGAEVTVGECITHAEADVLLQQDVEAAEITVAHLIEIVLTPNEFAALVSFEFNTGALADTPGLALLNRRQFHEAWDNHLCLYIRDANNAPLPGLVRRRAAERALFFTP